MKWKAISKSDTIIYKGIGILMIVVHNFMHIFPNIKQNEDFFWPGRFYNYLKYMWAQPQNSIEYSFSFFGHFGVQIFIFLSAYGLTKKYKNTKIEYSVFIKNRVLKIYPIFLWAILFAYIIVGTYFGGLTGSVVLFLNTADAVLLKILLLSNFIPGYTFLPIGPWWFIPFIFQFYFIFPFLFYWYKRKGNSILIILSLITIGFSFITHTHVGGVSFYQNIIGHFPEFAFAIYIANNDEKGINFPNWIIFTSVFIFILGNFYEFFWYFNHLTVIIIFLSVLNLLKDKIYKLKLVSNFLYFVGSISMALFLVNGFLRAPFVTWAMEINNPLITILLSLLSLIIAILVSILLTKTESYMRNKVGKKTFIFVFIVILLASIKKYLNV